MHKIAIVIITIVLFQSFMIKDDSFTKYCQFLRSIDLPLKVDCEKNINYPDYSTIPESLDEKYRPVGHKTLGIINLNKNIISIIQVAQAENEFPMIFNYRKDGTPIDTLSILAGSCSSCPQYVTHSVSFIGVDKDIIMRDSSFYYQLKRNGDRGKRDSLVIYVWNCIMNDLGHFKKVLLQKEKK
jgi:hypothetical protein